MHARTHCLHPSCKFPSPTDRTFRKVPCVNYECGNETNKRASRYRTSSDASNKLRAIVSRTLETRSKSGSTKTCQLAPINLTSSRISQSFATRMLFIRINFALPEQTSPAESSLQFNELEGQAWVFAYSGLESTDTERINGGLITRRERVYGAVPNVAEWKYKDEWLISWEN